MRQNSRFGFKFFAWILATSAIFELVRAQGDLTDESTTVITVPNNETHSDEQNQTTTYDETSTQDQNATTGHSDNGGEPRNADANLGQFTFPSPSSCNNDLNCIRYRPYYETECTKETCIYFAAYQPLRSDNMDVVFHLSASNADYVAIGFTDDSRKVNTDIIACVRNDKEVIIAKSYFWKDASSNTATELSVGPGDLQLVKGEIVGKGLWCTVKRAVRPNNWQLKDLGHNYQQVYLWGSNDADGKPLFVDETTSVQSWEMSFASFSLSQKLNSNLIIHSEISPAHINCESNQLSCIRYETAPFPTGDCTYETCSFLLAFMMGVKQSQNWPLFLSANDAQYVGLGRTEDKSQWASTDVIGCRIVNNEVKPFHYWVSNPKQGYVRQIVPNGLKMLDGGVTKSGLWCSLSTLIHSVDLSYSNLTNPAYMLYMWGKVDEHGDPEHWAKGAVEVSDDLIDLTKDSTTHVYHRRSSASGHKVAGHAVWILALMASIAARISS